MRTRVSPTRSPLYSFAPLSLPTSRANASMPSGFSNARDCYVFADTLKITVSCLLIVTLVVNLVFLFFLIAKRHSWNIRVRFQYDSSIDRKIEHRRSNVPYREIRSMDWQPLGDIQEGSRFPCGTILARSARMFGALQENGVIRLPWQILSFFLFLCIYELTRFLSQTTKGTGQNRGEERLKKKRGTVMEEERGEEKGRAKSTMCWLGSGNGRDGEQCRVIEQIVQYCFD